MGIVIEQIKYVCNNSKHCGAIDEDKLRTKCIPIKCRWLRTFRAILEKPELNHVECPICGAIHHVPINQQVVFCSCDYKITNNAFLEV